MPQEVIAPGAYVSVQLSVLVSEPWEPQDRDRIRYPTGALQSDGSTVQFDPDYFVNAGGAPGFFRILYLSDTATPDDFMNITESLRQFSGYPFVLGDNTFIGENRIPFLPFPTLEENLARPTTAGVDHTAAGYDLNSQGTFPDSLVNAFTLSGAYLLTQPGRTDSDGFTQIANPILSSSRGNIPDIALGRQIRDFRAQVTYRAIEPQVTISTTPIRISPSRDIISLRLFNSDLLTEAQITRIGRDTNATINGIDYSVLEFVMVDRTTADMDIQRIVD